MTALKPIENLRVRGVASETYETNKICAHPECSEEVPDRGHHIFPRSLIKSDSYFVAIRDDEKEHVIPHVVGLCREHHDAVEDHRAWIKLEDDVFVWYDRNSSRSVLPDSRAEEWERLGPLNPQPGEPASKPRKRRFSGEAKRVRKTVSVRVPNDAEEDGAGILDDLVTQLEDELGHDPHRPTYFTLVDGLNFALMWVRDNPREVDDSGRV